MANKDKDPPTPPKPPQPPQRWKYCAKCETYYQGSHSCKS